MGGRNTWGAVILSLRKAKGIAQRELGKMTARCHVSIGNIETGKNTATMNTLTKIADAFGMKASKIIGMAEDMAEGVDA